MKRGNGEMRGGGREQHTRETKVKQGEIKRLEVVREEESSLQEVIER